MYHFFLSLACFYRVRNLCVYILQMFAKMDWHFHYGKHCARVRAFVYVQLPSADIKLGAMRTKEEEEKKCTRKIWSHKMDVEKRAWQQRRLSTVEHLISRHSIQIVHLQSALASGTCNAHTSKT